MRRTRLTALSLPTELVEKIDRIVKKDIMRFRNRSYAFSIFASTGLNDFEQGKELKDFVNKLFGG